MGLLLSGEIPVYQHIKFSDNLVPPKMETMMKEMIRRDTKTIPSMFGIRSINILIWSRSTNTLDGTTRGRANLRKQNGTVLFLTNRCLFLNLEAKLSMEIKMYKPTRQDIGAKNTRKKSIWIR